MITRLWFFFFILLVSSLHIVLVPTVGAVINIMPLGDSITQGYASGEPNENRQISYRKALWGKLINAGYDVDFVGSLNSGSALFADGDHEGHPGWTAYEIANGRPVTDPGAGNLADWLADYQPDIMLLHIGTNGLDPSPDDVADILDVIDNYSLDTYVILARIINRACCEDIPPCLECGTTTAFNDNVEDIAYSRVYNTSDLAYPDNIIFGSDVDMEYGAGIDYDIQPAGDMYDNLHLYQYATGYDKMADVWFSAIQQVLNPQVSLLYTPVTPCRIVDTRNTSAGIIGASTQRNFHVYGSGATISDQGGNAAGCPSPLGEPLAAHINMVAVNPTGKGNLQAFPVGAGAGAGLSVNYNTIDTNLANAGTVRTISGAGEDILFKWGPLVHPGDALSHR